MSKTWAGGSTRAWRRTRAHVLARDGYRCRAHHDGWCDRVPGQHQCTDLALIEGPNAGHGPPQPTAAAWDAVGSKKSRTMSNTRERE